LPDFCAVEAAFGFAVFATRDCDEEAVGADGCELGCVTLPEALDGEPAREESVADAGGGAVAWSSAIGAAPSGDCVGCSTAAAGVAADELGRKFAQPVRAQNKGMATIAA
jgi:hypothetical protein